MAGRRSHSMHLAIWALVILTVLGLGARWLEPRLAFFPATGEDVTPRDAGAAYDALTVTTADGERLRAWILHGPAPRARIVYFHGNGGNLSNWSPILADIAGHGYDVFAVDYRGYGVSTGHPTERGLYRDVEAVVAQAWSGDRGEAPTVYWGRSLGATMAAYAAGVRAPDGVILESGFPDVWSVVRGSPVLVLLYPFASYRFRTAEHMGRVQRPALVLHGDRDSVIPFELGRALFDRLQEPKRFVAIAGGDHNDAVPADARAYWPAIDKFIEGLRRPHAGTDDRP
jgi:uncharacterized protein